MSDNFPVTESTAQEVNAFSQQASQNFTASASASASVGGFLRFSGNTGQWEFGKDYENFNGVEIYINSLQAQHGFIRWGTKPPAKAHTKVTDALPAAPAPFDGVDENGRSKTHMAQPSRILVGVTTDEDQDVVNIELGSMGGVENTDKLISAIMVKAQSSTFFFPVVKLASEFYVRSTGKVFKPVFEITEWRDVENNLEGSVKAIDTPVVEEVAPVVEAVVVAEAPKKRRRKATA